MVKGTIVLLFILLIAVGSATNGIQKIYPRGVAGSGEDLQVWEVTLTTNSTGFTTYSPAQKISGKLYSIAIEHANTLTDTMIFNMTSEIPYSLLVECYNLSLGNTTAFPRSSTNMYPLAGDVSFEVNNVSGGGGNSAEFTAVLTLEV